MLSNERENMNDYTKAEVRYYDFRDLRTISIGMLILLAFSRVLYADQWPVLAATAISSMIPAWAIWFASRRVE